MPTYVLEGIDCPWGDYGRLLHNGMSMHLSRLNGRIRLERTGPDIAPITFPGAWDIVVTPEFRDRFHISGLRGVRFTPVIKHHIVDLDWASWDVTEDEPPELPESGEPEDYILSRPHSPSAALGMPDLFELVASDETDADVHYLPATKIVALSSRAKDWFGLSYGDYISIRNRG